MAQEKQFEKKVEKFLTNCGIYQAGTPDHKMITPIKGWFTKIWGGGFQKEGIPDLIVCINGFFMTVELKSSTGRPSDIQKKNTKMINESGGIGLILYPEGFDAFKELVKGVIICKCPTAGLKALQSVQGNLKCNMWKD